MSGFELVGKDVITSDGRNVGTVADIAIDPILWTVRDFRVTIDRRIAEELGIQKRGGGAFLIKAASIKSVGDLIMLNQTMRALAEQATAARKAGDAEPFD